MKTLSMWKQTCLEIHSVNILHKFLKITTLIIFSIPFYPFSLSDTPIQMLALWDPSLYFPIFSLLLSFFPLCSFLGESFNLIIQDLHKNYLNHTLRFLLALFWLLIKPYKIAYKTSYCFMDVLFFPVLTEE